MIMRTVLGRLVPVTMLCFAFCPGFPMRAPQDQQIPEGAFAVKSLERLSEQLSAEIISKGEDDVLVDSFTRRVRSRITHSETYREVHELNSPRLESSILEYGESPLLQVLGVALWHRRYGDTSRLPSFIAASRCRHLGNIFGQILLEDLTAEWSESHIVEVRRSLDSGLQPPASEVTGSLLGLAVPPGVSYKLLMRDHTRSVRSTEWDAALLGAIAVGLSEKRLQLTAAQRHDLHVICGDALKSPGNARYHAFSLFAEDRTAEEVVTFLNDFQHSFDEVKFVLLVELVRPQLEDALKRGLSMEPALEKRLRDMPFWR